MTHPKDTEGLEDELASLENVDEHETPMQGLDEAEEQAEQSSPELKQLIRRQKKRAKRASAQFERELLAQQREDVKFADGRARRLERLKSERDRQDEALSFDEAAESVAEQGELQEVPPDPGEEANLRRAFGDRWASHPEAVAHRRRYNEVVADANLVVRRRPITPEREGAPAYKYPGTHAQVGWESALRFFRAQDAAWERGVRLDKLRCKALAKGKAGRIDGERCGRPIPDAERTTRETCSSACKQRLTAERARLRKTSP